MRQCMPRSAVSLLLLTLPLCAQSSPGPVPVFRMNANTVLVDVVATDAAGNPIRGLTAADFSLSEDGKPRRIDSFAAHVPTTRKVMRFHLPPHQYTNVPSEVSDLPITIILFDSLNTPVLDQQYAKKQLLQMLKGLPSGQRVALMTLGEKLVLLHDVTGSSDELIAAADTLSGNQKFLQSQTQDQRDQDFLEAFRMAAAATASAPAGATGNATASGGTPAAATSDRGEPAMDDPERSMVLENQIREQDRLGASLRALADIANLFAGYNVRKNLIWMSGTFPLSILPLNERSQYNHYNQIAGAEDAVRSAAALLQAAKISLYPVDVTGLDSNNTDLSSNQQGDLRTTFATRTEKFTDMDSVARATGGHAFFNTNAIGTAVARSIEEGNTYYTLSFAPPESSIDGKFHRIKVTTTRPGAHLSYRESYLAAVIAPQDKAAATEAATVRTAMRPGVRDFTALFMKVQVDAPEKKKIATSIRITYLFDPETVTFAIAPDGSAIAIIDYMAACYALNGTQQQSKVGTLAVTLTGKEYQSALRTGLQAVQDLPAPASGNYRIRIGASDRASRRIGTIEVPITVP